MEKEKLRKWRRKKNNNFNNLFRDKGIYKIE